MVAFYEQSPCMICIQTGWSRQNRAMQIDYTIVNQVSSYNPPRIPGHGGVRCRVFGANVRRVQLVTGLSLEYISILWSLIPVCAARDRSLPDVDRDLIPIGTLSPGIDAVQHNNEGGFGER